MTQPSKHFVYAIVGADRFLRGDALDRLFVGMAGDLDSLGPTRFNGEAAELADVLDEVRTPSLLGNRRVVVMDDADSFITNYRKTVEKYCLAPCPSGILIFLCDSLPRNTNLFKIISAHGMIIPCEPPRPQQVGPWIVAQARDKYGKRMNPNAAQLLRDHLGNSPGVLDAELSKLATYVGTRPEITPADLEALTGCHREENVFVVIDAMASGHTAQALRLWEQVLATDRAAQGRSIAGLAWGVRQLLHAKREREAGASIEALAGPMKTSASALEGRLKRVTTQQLEQQQRALLAADVAVKTGASTVELAVEKFIVTHSADSVKAIDRR